MEEKEVISLVKDLTGLDEQLIKNSLANKDDGQTVLKNVFKEKFKVLDKTTFDTREANVKADAIKEFSEGLIDKAKKQELPRDLYNAIANNVISKQNKKLVEDLKLSVDDYTSNDAIKKAVIKKYANNDTLKEDFEHVQSELEKAKALLNEKETTFQKELTKTKTDNVYSQALNSFNIDANDDEELTKRRFMADSIFKNNYNLDLVEGKIVVKNKRGDVLKHEDTRAPFTVDEIFNSEIVKYVPVKQQREPGKDGVVVNTDTTVITTMEEFDKFAQAKGMKPESNEYVLELSKYLKNFK